MKKQLHSFIMVMALALVGSAAHAQYSLRINEPANLAGVVPNTFNPAGDWGFGTDLEAVPPATGFCQIALPDSLVADTATSFTNPRSIVGNLDGKIAIIYRGSSEFGTKALAAQQAGAVGVIIVNSTAAAITPGNGHHGGDVNIPVILVQHNFTTVYRDAINAGTLNVTIGTVSGSLANNLALKLKNFVPEHTVIPTRMVQDVGDFTFPVGGFIYNMGTQNSGQARLKAVIERLTPTYQLLYMDSAVMDTSALGSVTTIQALTPDSAVAVLPDFDLVTADPTSTDRAGQYRLTYIVSQDIADDNMVDNMKAYDFYLTANRFSKSQVNFVPTSADYYQPTVTTSIRVDGAGTALKWGIWHHVHAVGGVVNSIDFTAATNDTTDITNETVDVEVVKWVDANNDSIVDVDEAVTVATGGHQFTGPDEEFQIVHAPVQDLNSTTGDIGYTIDPNTIYFYTASYSGNKPIYIGANDDLIDYDLNLRVTALDQYLPLFDGATWGGFRDQSAVPAIIVNIGVSNADTAIDTVPIAVRQNVIASMKVYPNPATDFINIGLVDHAATGLAVISVLDLAGHQVLSQQAALQGANSTFRLPTTSLPTGIYNVVVTTPRGRKTQKLAITR